MRTLKTYNQLSEGLFFNKWYKTQRLVTKDLGINLYCVATFGTSIAALYPFFESIVKNTEMYKLSDQDIVLLSICAVSILFKESKDNINKMMTLIKEKGLTELLDKFISTLKNFTKLFETIATTFGKTIKGMMDMIAYTTLLVPLSVAIIDVINLYKLDFNTFDKIMTNPVGALVSTGIGVLTISLKQIISVIVKKINRLLKSKKTPEIPSVVQSFESVNKLYENYFGI